MTATVTLDDLCFSSESIDLDAIADCYAQHGCFVIRGLLKNHVPAILADIERAVAEAYQLVGEAEEVAEGWRSPDGSLFIPGEPGSGKERQLMCLSLNYKRSAAFFRSASDPRVGDIAERILGPDVELFDLGQALVKEADGGHPKLLHQDAAYFEHAKDGPLAMLGYAVDTDLARGALHVVPGSHRDGYLRHVDTFSHLGLPTDEWPFDRAVAIEGEAGDAIFFHQFCIHGSPNNVSGQPRPVFISRYRAVDDYVLINATTVDKRERAEESQAAARKDGQERILIRGFRSELPE